MRIALFASQRLGANYFSETRRTVRKLSAFTFITPLFGVVASYFIMHDTLTPVFGAAALLVIAGLYLVNRPNPVVPVPTDPLLNVTKT